MQHLQMLHNDYDVAQRLCNSKNNLCMYVCVCVHVVDIYSL
jgi:hypothetical protein